MVIAIGTDHGGICLKKAIIDALKDLKIEYIDYGIYEECAADYPDMALDVAQAVASGKCDSGILLCGTGIGIAIAANKVKGIRAATCHNLFTAEACKSHNNANIITLGGRVVTDEMAADIVKVWIKTEFMGGRHLNRIDKIAEIEKLYFK